MLLSYCHTWPFPHDSLDYEHHHITQERKYLINPLSYGAFKWYICLYLVLWLLALVSQNTCTQTTLASMTEIPKHVDLIVQMFFSSAGKQLSAPQCHCIVADNSPFWACLWLPERLQITDGKQMRSYSLKLQCLKGKWFDSAALAETESWRPHMRTLTADVGSHPLTLYFL